MSRRGLEAACRAHILSPYRIAAGCERRKTGSGPSALASSRTSLSATPIFCVPVRARGPPTRRNGNPHPDFVPLPGDLPHIDLRARRPPTSFPAFSGALLVGATSAVVRSPRAAAGWRQQPRDDLAVPSGRVRDRMPARAAVARTSVLRAQLFQAPRCQ